MSNYFEINDLNSIYLEDSFVLGIVEENDEIGFELEFVLTESHPLYTKPPKSDRYCYKKGILLFKGASAVVWKSRDNRSFVDKDGATDNGNIDCFSFSGKDFKLSGDWGGVNFKANSVVVFFDS